MIGIGQTLGNYQIVSKLGAGGMGAVYMAEHPLIGKKVALKVIHRELAMNREVVTRFFNEARAVNQIGNDHIVDISDFGQTPEGEYFFIMEWLNGKSLGDVLQAERILSVPRVFNISAQLAEALAASHASSIIHRDLKPDNVFLVHKMGDNDFVKILDFGLAKLVGDGAATGLTKQGVILGTPQYMSPEQCESKGNVDHRTDIYSLGILMYQMLTGYLPFDGQSMGEVLVKQVTQPVTPPSQLNGQIPPALEQIVLRCLAKRVDARFQHMAEVLGALKEPDRYMAGGGAMSAARTQMSGAAVAPGAGMRGSGQVKALGVGGAAAGSAATMILDGGSHAAPGGVVAGAIGGGAGGGAAAEARTMFLPGGSHATPGAPGGPGTGGGVAEARTMFLPGGSHASTGDGAPMGAGVGGGMGAGVGGGMGAMAPMAGGFGAPVDGFGAPGQYGAPGAFGGYEAPRLAIPRQPRGSGKKWALGIAFVVIAAGITAGVLLAVKSKKKTGGGAQPAPSAAPVDPGGAQPGTPGGAQGGTQADQPGTQPGASPGTQPDAPPSGTEQAGTQPGATPVVQDLRTVKITITSDPTGADLYDESGKHLGKTPTEIAIPRDTDRVLLFRHSECGEKRKVVRASNDTEISVALQRLEKVSPSGDDKPKSDTPRKKKRRRTGSDDEIMTPSL